MRLARFSRSGTDDREEVIDVKRMSYRASSRARNVYSAQCLWTQSREREGGEDRKRDVEARRRALEQRDAMSAKRVFCDVDLFVVGSLFQPA